MKLAEFDHLSLGYGRKIVAKDISFELGKGAYLGLVGANGSGKTTLLKAIVGALKPLQGSIRYFKDDKETNEPPKFGYMPQHQDMDISYPITVRNLVLMGRFAIMNRRLIPNKQDHIRVEECLEQVGILDLKKHSINELSGGQLQRALMARALASEPEVLLLDEPTNGMDIKATSDTLEIVDSLNKKGMSVILVSHQLDIVTDRAQTVGLLLKEEGSPSTMHVGTPEEMKTEFLSKLYKRKVSELS